MDNFKNDIEELEKLRKSELDRQKNKEHSNMVIAIIPTISGLLYLILFDFPTTLPSKVLFGLIFGSIIFICGYLMFRNREPEYNSFKIQYKTKLVYNELKNLFDDVYYDYQTGLSKEALIETNMIKIFPIFKSTDYVSAKYNGIKLYMSNVNMLIPNSDGEDYSMFHGQWFVFDFNKSFTTNVQIFEEEFRCARISDEYSKIQTEDIDFNEKFNVYAEDELNAFYILTPHLIEKLKHINDELPGKYMFAFFKNKLYIGLDNEYEMFDHDINKVLTEEAYKKIFTEIKVITHFIDTLDLDNDLFKKGE